jgi:putative peptidoglycan lipid II flippase
MSNIISDKTEQDHLVNTADSGMQAQNQNNRHSSIFKNALKMAFGTMTSRLLGLVRESLLAALFDKHITDSWNVAFSSAESISKAIGRGISFGQFYPSLYRCR